MTTAITKTNNGQIEESLDTIKSRLKSNLAELKRVVERASAPLKIAIGRDLMKAQKIVEARGWVWTEWVESNLDFSYESARVYIRAANDYINASKSSRAAQDRQSITDRARARNPNYALPRQKVDELPVRNILAGISSKIFVERAKNEAKEGRLKKQMALELVDAGYRVLSVKAHSDKGGSDDAMRRLGEIRKALKAAISEGLIVF